MPANRPLDANLARRRLGVGPDASAAELRRAFNRAVKAVHPDRHGGDGRALREVIEAYRWLDAAEERPPARPADAPAPCLTLSISITQALSGGWAQVDTIDGRFLSVRLPAGLRQRERVRIDGHAFEVAIVGDAGLEVAGDDVLAIAAVDPAILADGGRVMVDTPSGQAAVWISKADGASGFVRLAGLGLPARGARPAGDLVVRLKPAAREQFDTPAQVKRRRFAAAWAA